VDGEDDQPVSSWLFVILGAVLVVVGGVWTLQGIGVLGGSVMSGVALWAIVGPLVMLLGLWVVWRGVRRLRA
jgi:hypothetical protein